MTALSLMTVIPTLALAAGSAFAAEQGAVRPSESTPAVTGGMVSAANRDAVNAGLEALRAGGSAVDAAIAVQTVLGLVEPQSSGIGGGAFMIHYDARSGDVSVYNGRETAPAGAGENLFIDPETGEPYGFVQAWRSGLSTGAPGVIALLARAHADHGALDWSTGFDHAITLAENGFEVAPRLNALASRMAQFTDMNETGLAARYLYDADGEAFPAGHVLTNPAYAASLRLIAQDWRNFYEGALAQAMVDAVHENPLAGTLSLEDLASYAALEEKAICTPYRRYRLCSAPPPSSGGVAIGALMGMLAHFDMSAYGPDTAEGWALFIEASRLAYADRDEYIGDPAFADIPVAGLINPVYLARRASLINPAAAMADIEPGAPPGSHDQADDISVDRPGTSHFVVVDGSGNAVSMTTTVESPFGSGRMAGGFFLNNQLTDFSFVARDKEGRMRPNAPQAGKRPRSSMSPTLVFDETGAFELATGSPGGNSIIAYTAKSLVAMLDWGLSPQDAATLPNVVARGNVVRTEAGFDGAILTELQARGFTVEGNRGEISGLHIVRAGHDGALIGGADPRRDGLAAQP